MFQEPALFQSSGKEAPTLVCPWDRATSSLGTT